MNRNSTIKAGNCNPRRYELVRTGAVRPSAVLTRVEELTGALEAYDRFDERQEGWHKVAFDPAAT
jgi:threonine dehydrogenase-like Zn-dependent dehydrogenase